MDAYLYPIPPEYYANEKYGARGVDEEQALPPSPAVGAVAAEGPKSSRFKLMFARKRSQAAVQPEPEHMAEDHNPFSDKNSRRSVRRPTLGPRTSS